MKRWHLPSLAESSDKLTEREPGADAPRVPSLDHQKPRVLFSSAECRAVVLDLQRGQDLGDHHVRERAIVQVISGRVSINTSQETIECDTGTLVTFEPGERHSVHGIQDARLLLLLAPWPGHGHNTKSEPPHDQHLPKNATATPLTTPPANQTRKSADTGD